MAVDLKTYSKDFLEEILIDAESNDEFQEDRFTSKVIEYLVEVGECIDPTVCYFRLKGKAVKINAYDIQEDDDSIDLFISYFENTITDRKMSEKSVQQHFKYCENFFKKSIEGFGNELEESHEVFDVIQNIYSIGNTIRNVRIYFLTNRITKPFKMPNKKINDINIFFYVWDMERIYQCFVTQKGKEDLKINFVEEYGIGIPCITIPTENDIYDAYVAIFSGKIIAEVYAKWGQRLIERNVRSFLQARGNVNKGIRSTLKTEPQMFMAYNNGLSTTAAMAVFKRIENGIIEITELIDWQIVNGGQTTATLYEALKAKVNIEDVYVQVKLTILKDIALINDVVPSISRYANSQTKVNVSDFASNNEYHIALEKYSRQIWAPNLAMGKPTNKWYYERVRGQYLVDLGRCKTTSEKNKFKMQNPSDQKIVKTDIAKSIMSWEQHPHTVSKGGEYNFNSFMTFVKDNTKQHQADEVSYKRLIALTILFKKCDKVVKQLNFGGYKANIVTYSIAMLSYLTDMRLNLDKIWQEQDISNSIQEALSEIAFLVFDHITSPPKIGTNVTQWCKREECWELLKRKKIELPVLNSELKTQEQKKII